MLPLTSQLYHLHGRDLVPMEPRPHHDASDHDIDRELARGGQVYRCTRCEEDVVVVPAGHEDAEVDARS